MFFHVIHLVTRVQVRIRRKRLWVRKSEGWYDKWIDLAIQPVRQLQELRLVPFSCGHAAWAKGWKLELLISIPWFCTELSRFPCAHLQVLPPPTFQRAFISGEKPAVSDVNHQNSVSAFSGPNLLASFQWHGLQEETSLSCACLPCRFLGNHLVQAFKEL